jgi:hypothetical protein
MMYFDRFFVPLISQLLNRHLPNGIYPSHGAADIGVDDTV